jgi:hypothetical protein
MIGFVCTFLQLQSIITANNQWLSKTRSIPCWTTSVFSSAATDLVPIYESITSSPSVVRWLTLHSLALNSLTNELRLNWNLEWRLPYDSVVLKVRVKSNLLYDWRFTASQFILASSPWDPRPQIFSNWTLAVIVFSNILSDETVGLYLMNMIDLSSNVYFAHIACYWKFFFLQYTQVQVLQSRSCLSYVSYATTAA